MPRCARVKSFDSVYHIMVRSISDNPLFKSNTDKERYLRLVKKYQGVYLFKVYAYCIMDTHAHMIVDGAGADISKIMHSINQCYAQYFNFKYNRHGHLFQDRFKSKIVYNDRGLITLSAYIHTNPTDIKVYTGKEESYKYSSFGIYLGLREDTYDIVDTDFILSQMNINRIAAIKEYWDYIIKYKGESNGDVEFRHERADYRTERQILVRNIKPVDVIEYVAAYTDQNKSGINIKYSKYGNELKSLCALLMRGLCDMKQKEICREIGNITQSHAARLCLKGLKLINEKDKYKNLIREFIEKRKVCRA